MKRLLCALAALLLAGEPAFAQIGPGAMPPPGGSGAVSSVTGTGLVSCSPTTGAVGCSLASIASGDLAGNNTAGSAAPADTTLTSLIDRAICGTQGDLLYRGASAWVCLATGNATPNPQALVTGGAAANPSFASQNESVIGTLLGYNINGTTNTDTAITITAPSSLYILEHALVTNCTTSVTTAKFGFFLNTGGTGAIWSTAVTTVYTGLTTAQTVAVIGGGQANGALGSNTTFTETGSTTIQVRLGTAQGAAATCDIYIIGLRLN